MKGPYILTATGGHFHFLEPAKSYFSIEDIAHALSHICRFGGHVTQFYSVAQHSVFVSHLVPPEHALAGLLHDAHEAFLGDIPRPLKGLLPDFNHLDREIAAAVRLRFGTHVVLDPEVKHADLVALATERRDLMPEDFRGAGWDCLIGIEAFNGPRLAPRSSDYAKSEFLARWNELKG